MLSALPRRRHDSAWLLPVLVLASSLVLVPPASATGSQSQGSCAPDHVAPVPTSVAVTEVPIQVASTTDDYFVLYRLIRRSRNTVISVPISVTRGVSGTTTLTDSLRPLGADHYRVEKYSVSHPADIDGDCVDDLTELADVGAYHPLNAGQQINREDGRVVIDSHEAFLALSYQGDWDNDVMELTLPELKGRKLIKFWITDLDTSQPAVYFQNTHKHQVHGSFARTIGLWNKGFEKTVTGHLIWEPNVVAPDGTLGVYRYFLNPSQILFTAFWTIERYHEILASVMPVVDNNLSYYLDSRGMVDYYENNRALIDATRVSVLLDHQLRPDVGYVPLNAAEGYGRLRLMEDGERPGLRDVAIYGSLPNDLPRVAGTITTVPQTPLSHVNLRAVQNGLPNAFIRDVLDDESVAGLIGSHVHFSVKADGYTIREATKAEVDAHFEKLRPTQTQMLQRDLSVTEIASLADVEFADWTAFGVKAANVAELAQLSLPDGTTPVGFAVPFYFYDEFMKQATVSEATLLGKKKWPDDEKITLAAGTTLASAVTQMLAHARFQADYDVQEEMLDDLRNAIKDATAPQFIIDALTTMHAAYPDGQSLRYRSSTNNEDLPSFSGAGLYSSKTQDPDETTDDGIDKSIKGVWASLWNYRAFLERDFHRVDHTTVSMGVLVHPNYSDELVNGVAVSHDPITLQDDVYYVNAQVGEDLVTNPEAYSQPEQLLLDANGAATVLSRSSLAASDRSLMSDAHMRQLRSNLKTIHDRFETLYEVESGQDFAIEVEFKITADNRLAIKQARPWIFAEPLGMAKPAVSVAFVRSVVTEGTPVDIVVTRSGGITAVPLSVNLRWSETGEMLISGGPTSVTIPAGQTSATSSVQTEADDEVERDSIVTVSLASSDAYDIGNHNSAAVIVKDDDTPKVSIAAGADITEGGDAVFTVSAVPAPAAALDVTVAVAQSGDFGVLPGSHTVTVPASGSATLTVATTGDAADEADGSVTARVSAGTGYAVSATAAAASVAVADDDDGPVSTGDPCVAALSGDGSVTGEWAAGCVSSVRGGRYARFYSFSLDAPSRVRVDLVSSADTYLYLRAGSARKSGAALAFDDDGGDGYDSRISRTLAAGGYTIEATTYHASAAGPFTLTVAGIPTQTVVQPDPEVSIAAGAGVTEGGDAIFTVTAVPAPSAGLDVAVAVTQSGDFGVSPGSRTVTVPATGSATLTVATTDDSADEADGSVTAALSAGSGYTVSAAAASASVAVADDDDAVSVCVPSLPLDAVTVSEVTGWRDGHSGAAHVLRWNRVLAALGTDTGAAPMTVEQSRANESQFMFSRWDRVTRTLEALELCDDPPPPPPAATPEVSITAGAGVTEGGDAVFTVTAVPAPSAPLTVDVTVVQAGDFGVSPGSRTVTVPTSGTAAFTVATVNDTADEADGSVTVTVGAGIGYTVSASAAAATVAVRDDDDPAPPPPAATPEVSVTAGADIDEGADAAFAVTADPAPSAPLTVDVTVAQSGDLGAATGSRTVTIPVSGSFTLTVATTDDSVDEADGSVTVTLDAGTGYTVSQTAAAATVAVADDDDPPPPPPADPVISIIAGNGITEGGDATFAVTADPAPAAPLTVDVTVAQSGDFGVSPGTRTVTIPTSGSVTLTVATADDGADEADGSVTVTVDAGSGYTVSATAGSASVAVADDDPAPPPPLSSKPSISVGDATAGEGDGAVEFIVRLSAASSAAVTVYYAANPGTAMPYADYLPDWGRVTFAAGDTSKTVRVSLIDDRTPGEADETFVLKLILSDTAHATLADSQAQGTITDND